MAQKELSIDDIVAAFKCSLGIAREMLKKDGGPGLLMPEKDATALLLENIKKQPGLEEAIDTTLDRVAPTNASWMLVKTGTELELLRGVAPKNTEKAAESAPAEGGGSVGLIQSAKRKADQVKERASGVVQKIDQAIPGGTSDEQKSGGSK